MNVTINQEENNYHVILEGRIDTTNADQFQHDIEPLMTAKDANITLDCAAMEYTSSQGLRTFLMLQKSVMAHNGKLEMINMQPQVKEIFDITGFSNIITIK
ncbi:MAG: STAS domain-containing protein [Bacteroidales bacterium]|jgi:anti-anti-sigma factor|nr:STAS domain-containing protein [Bacteroidales bacterium]